jgi:hypothetical protein
MRGDRLRFARQDEVEGAWRIVDPLLADPPPAAEHEPGSWGVAAAQDLIASPVAWHNPVVAWGRLGDLRHSRVNGNPDRWQSECLAGCSLARG